ncbi:phosphatidic acid phosphatase type 2/haloperoxidase [Ilyonectria robusta]|uniref:phosphatidic acid phosphatase type 2/haloperoxidase n=1 Tax=Ilyonectria robusta TaxID=1079257 RepID=UPI001E8EEA86|nr:phosphatidic acid phosphatase type 2/haloperoxidase [Ilyonectria robusta]KAH8685286.1 phosphatidic acid phosphatase type 2/haloperoxidase [Ilyonectria robusta]
MPSRPQPNRRHTTTIQKFKTFAIEWIKLSWLDLLCMAVVGGVTTALYHAPIPTLVTRTFPITFDSSGDIIYPQWAYPYRGWIIPSWLAGLISIAIPIATYLLAQIRIKSAWDASNAIIGTVWAVTLASVFQVALKQLVGGFRPYFLDVCMPDISLAGSHNESGLNGVGFQQIMYTIGICTQPDRAKLKNAVTSFPSGHSSAALSAFGFLFLWLNAKLKVWADHKPAFWKLTLTFLPLLGAVLICGSLTIDAAHNWYDIVAGSCIGVVMAFAAYRTSYAAVWDWRFNHLPLQSKEAFRYGFDGDVNYAGQTLSGSVGWGAKREWPHGGLDSAASSTMFARSTSGIQDIAGVDGDASGRARAKRRAPVGDEAV